MLVLFVAPAAVRAQTLQLVPSTHTDRAPQSFLDACMNLERWPTLFGRTTYLGAVSWQLRRDRASDAVLAPCFARMKAHELQLSLEVGVTSIARTGLQAYQIGWAEWQRYLDLGAPLTALFLDEPLTNGSLDLGLSYATVVEETANFLALIRRNPRLANIKLILIEAYPHLDAGTITALINDVNNAAAVRSVSGLDGLQIDHAWDARTPWSGSDLGAMSAAAHRRRMEFSMIFYAAMPFQNPTNDCDFRSRLMQQWNTYRSNGIEFYGFYPDIYTVQSWDPLPSITIPESTTACTFMQGAKQWVESIDPTNRLWVMRGRTRALSPR
jgi:hypothetical protein